MKANLKISCAVAAILCGGAGVAFGQTAGSATTAGADVTAGGVEEIIVTAERREQIARESADDDAGVHGRSAAGSERLRSRRPSEIHAQRDLRQQRPGPGRNLHARPEQRLPRQPVHRHRRPLSQRRDLSRRTVDAVPGPQRRHLHGRHAARRSAGRSARHAVRRRRRSRRASATSPTSPNVEQFSANAEGMRRLHQRRRAERKLQRHGQRSRSSTTSSPCAAWSTTITRAATSTMSPARSPRSDLDPGNVVLGIHPAGANPVTGLGRVPTAEPATTCKAARAGVRWRARRSPTTTGSPAATQNPVTHRRRARFPRCTTSTTTGTS